MCETDEERNKVYLNTSQAMNKTMKKNNKNFNSDIVSGHSFLKSITVGDSGGLADRVRRDQFKFAGFTENNKNISLPF